jgi:hypothetical protein
MVRHVWESVTRGNDWRHDLWVCADCGRVILKRATGPDKPPSDELLGELRIPLDCDEEKVRQPMES